MTERDFSVKIMTAAKLAIRGAVTIKHSDRATIGVPDIQVLALDKASWIETKYQRVGEALKSIISYDQILFCHQLATVCGGRAWIAVFSERHVSGLSHQNGIKETTVWSPRGIASHLYPNMHPSAPEFLTVAKAGCEPFKLWNYSPGDDYGSLPGLIRTHGAIQVNGWYPHLIAQVIREAVLL